MPDRPLTRREKDRLPDRDTIRELLLTWQVRQMRGDVSVPPPPNDGRDDPEWSWKYEQQYGAPKRDDRELVLRTGLNVLSDGGKKDIGPVIAALQQIKGRAFENAMNGLHVDLLREYVKEAEVVRRNLTKWLVRAVDLHRRLNPDDLAAGRRFRQMYEDMLTALTFGVPDVPMTERERALRDWVFDPSLLKAATRREKQGNPDAKLVKAAHRLLAEAGVPRDQHGDLLWALGLVDESGNLPRRRPRSRRPSRRPG